MPLSQWCCAAAFVFASAVLQSCSAQTPIEVYFAPYDSSTPVPAAGDDAPTNLTALQTDISFIYNVTAAKKAYDLDIARTGAEPRTLGDDPISNPFVIQFCVYNVLDSAYIDPLIAAWKAGVFVQVIMDHTNLKEEYVPTWQIFHDAGMKVTATKNVTQRTLSLEEKLTLNLIGADVGSLMHMKLRYFRWLDNATAPVSEAVVTGSLNPEVTATINDDTLVVFRGATEDIQRYRNATADVLEITHAANSYDDSRQTNVMYSQAEVEKGTEDTALVRRVLLDLVRNETESILVSVYSLRSIDDGEGQPLVEALCAARQRGVGVAVITDKGQSDGEPGFAGGDDTVTAWRLWQCGIPVYKAKNYNGKYTALHHKNAVFGAGGKRLIVITGTANWSKASMGNGTHDTKPSNSETTLIVDSLTLDDGNTGYRYMSNFLRLLRDYEYQQACPYIQNGKTEHANCEGDEEYNQPNWTQPGARNVTASLISAQGVVAAGGWPEVGTVFTVNVGGATDIEYVVNGGESQKAPLHDSPVGGSMQTDTLSIPFGSIVDCTILSGAGPSNVTTVIVDAAYDWNSDVPVRRSSDELSSMSITVQL